MTRLLTSSHLSHACVFDFFQFDSVQCCMQCTELTLSSGQFLYRDRWYLRCGAIKLHHFISAITFYSEIIIGTNIL